MLSRRGRAAGLTALVSGAVLAGLLLAPAAQAADGDPVVPPIVDVTTDPPLVPPVDPPPADTPPAPDPVPAPVVPAEPLPLPTEPLPAPVDPAPVAPVDPAPVDPAPVVPVEPPPIVLPAALGSWCEALYPPQRPKVEKRKAWELMRGTVDMGNGGTYYLSEHPNWRPQSGTDTSGDRHVHSLDWALPLLYRGVHKQKPEMVERFRQLLYYWIGDHRGPRNSWINATIYGGLRTQTLVCAAQTLNDPVIQQAALNDAARMVDGYWANRTVGIGTNNTDLIRQTGALAAYCWVGDIGNRDRAWTNLVAVARGVIQPDGSDVEGSPGYAMYIEKLLVNVEKSAATCGIPAEPIPTLRGLLYAFVAQAVRPDFKLASLGDTINQSLRGTFGLGDWRAEWIRSGGTAGTPPTPIYTAYDGGYVFGRAGWNPAPGGPDTFYSLRFSSSRPATAHAHDDGAAMTLYSRGVEWVGDPGPYRYENGSSLRWFMKSRPAHSSLTVSNVARTKSSGVRKVTSRSDWTIGGNDVTCLADNTWGSVRATRCTTYVRTVDAIIVVDYLNASKIPGKKKQRLAAPTRVVTQRWQVPPGIGASSLNDVLTLSSGDKRMDVYRTGGRGWDVRTARSGSSVGWFTGTWGERLPGAVLSRTVNMKSTANSQVLVTVFVPRVDGESAPVVIDANGVTVTRNGTVVTTALPVPS